MILRLANVTKKFGNVVAVDNVSFELKSGEVVGLIGGNGAGKTTISEMVAGITRPTTGSIEYGFKFDVKPQERIGIQFQDSAYPSGLTVKDIITFARNLHKIQISNYELKRLLESFRMADLFNRKARSLSGGQRQKLNILLSMLHQPHLVIFDEISTGLDLAAREEIIAFVSKLIKQHKITALIISHQMSEIRDLCNRVVILDHGHIVADESVASLEKKHGSLDAFMRRLIKDSISITSTNLLKRKSKGRQHARHL